MSRVTLCVRLGLVAILAGGFAATRLPLPPQAASTGSPERRAVAQHEGRSAGVQADRRSAAERSPAAARNLSDYYRDLRALGLAHEQTKPLILAELEQRAEQSLGRGRFRYWLRDGGRTAEDAKRRLVAAEAIRGALRAIYGPGAADDPKFKRYFRPLDARLEFLSSEQQLRVEKARVDFAAGHARFASGRPRQGGPAAGGAERVPLEYDAAWQKALGAMLDAPLLFEYSLRESALAEQLRSAGIELDEAEFREAYALLAELDASAGAARFREVRAALRALLGTERFDRLWAGRDPAFAVVGKLMRARDFSDATIVAAYGVLNAAQDDLAELAALNERDPLRAIERAREITAREEAALGDLVGAALARQILTARAQALYELSQRPAP